MKKLAFIISIFLMSYIYSESCDSKEAATGYKDCKDLTVSGNYKYCCFIKNSVSYKGQSSEYKSCESLTKEQYDQIKKYIDEVEAEAKKEGYEYKIEINCKSNYLQYYLATLLLLIL